MRVRLSPSASYHCAVLDRISVCGLGHPTPSRASLVHSFSKSIHPSDQALGHGQADNHQL